MYPSLGTPDLQGHRLISTAANETAGNGIVGYDELPA